uniref:Aminopeptidase M61 n=1 Tax=Myxococcus fulvus TaxID=33 RepID=UPI0025426A96|nr:Chain A, Aminopeptidase M61 [Myxococcus fulvus]7XYO_B Chain B, Aminopeptidase M61 [Myxococcus fulvus]
MGSSHHHHHHSQGPGDIHYRVKPVPAADRTDLRVTVQFQAPDATPLTVRLPEDCYGTPDLHQYVRSFQGMDGVKVSAGGDARERKVFPRPDGRVSLRYVLSFDPRGLDGVSFGPNVGPGHFHVAGCQWLLRLGDAEARRRYVIQVEDAPAGWKLYSSLGGDALRTETTASYEDLTSSALGGGSGGFHRFEVRGKSVSLFVDGAFDVPRQQLFTALERIITSQREWFQEDGPDYFHVALRPRSGIIAGVALDHAFICFAKRESRPTELHLLFAHEMFHAWLPGKLRIEPPKGEPELRHEWFSEGFTEYFARRLLVDARLLPEEALAELFNQDLINLADNPHRAETYEQVVKASRMQAYTSAYKKLAYYRGALMALDWDARLRAQGSGASLGKLLRELHALAAGRGGELSEDAFFDVLAAHGLEGRGDFERHILRGEPITVAPEALGPAFVPRARDVASFDPGLSLEQTFKARVLKGVIPGGPAYEAGLREGMKWVSARNSSRFVNGWRADLPLEIIVEVEGQPRRFAFFPRGPVRTLMLFQPRTPPGEQTGSSKGPKP